jgi:hypothetical protein
VYLSFIFDVNHERQQQFAHIPATIEALRNTQRASGTAIEGLCEGLMQAVSITWIDCASSVNFF